MDRERAETYLRLQAEVGLRRTASLPWDSAALAGCVARVRRAARVLTAVGALDDEVADQIVAGFELALGVRRASSVRGRMTGSWTSGAPMPAGSRPSGLGHVVPVGLVMPVRGQAGDGKIRLLSYAQLASRGLLTMIPDGMLSFLSFTVTDDSGTSYGMGLHGSGGADASGWVLRLHPDPPPGLRWLEVSTGPGEPATRIDLTRPAESAWVMVSTEAASSGEHFLTSVAAGLLAAALAHPREVRPYVAGLELMTVPGALGQVVAALQACDALPPSSPVPGQLAALCAHLNITGHGIAAPAAGHLPGPWLSVLGQYLRGAAVAAEGCAAAAVALPELDGITLTLLGLDGTTLYLHACGMTRHAGDRSLEPYTWPTIWIRDSARHWHATRIGDWSADPDGEVTMRMEVTPPLSEATARIELLAAGRSAQVRVRLPLSWL